MNGKELLKIAIKNNEVISYFKGEKGYKIQSYNGDPSNIDIQNFEYVVSSFHSLNKEYPDWNLSEILYKNIDKLLESNNPIDIYTSLNIIDGEISIESGKFATFKINNFEDLLKKFRDVLIKNKEELEKIKPPGTNFSIYQTAVNYNDVNVSKNRPSFL